MSRALQLTADGSMRSRVSEVEGSLFQNTLVSACLLLRGLLTLEE